MYVFTEQQGKLSLLHLLIWTTVRIGGVITKLMKEAKMRFPCRHFQLYGNSPVYCLQDYNLVLTSFAYTSQIALLYLAMHFQKLEI